MSRHPRPAPPAPDSQYPTLCVCGSACSARFPSLESHPVCPVSAPLTEHRVLRVRLRDSECQGFSPSRGQVTLPDTCVYPPVRGHLGCLHLSAGVARRPRTSMYSPYVDTGPRVSGGHPALGLLGPMETPVTLLKKHCPVRTQLHLFPCPILIVEWGWALTMSSRCVSLTVSEHLLPVGHSCFLFGEMSVQILCSFSFFFPSFFL